MIYQLIRRDPAWKATPWLALVSAVVWAWPSPMGLFGGVMIAAWRSPRRDAAPARQPFRSGTAD